jgi:hypothetical protein
MVKKLQNEIIETQAESDDEIEIKPKKEVITQDVEPPKDKKKYTYKKEFVFTDARKETMAKARQVKMDNAELRKLERESKQQEYLIEKERLSKLKDEKLRRKNQRDIKKLIKQTAEIEDVESEEEEIIIKKKTKPKKKIIYVESDDEPEIEYRKQQKSVIQQAPTYEKPPAQRKSVYYV